LILRRLHKKTPFFIAEISANHNGSISHAKKLISLAKKSGADAVKLQTYTPEKLTIKSKKSDFQINRGPWSGQILWELYKKAHTPYAWHKELFNYAKKLNITCFSTPFDESAVDFLESLNCPFYKVASFELTHIPLIKKIAKTKKLMIISTGMANLKEIDLTYKTAINYGAKEVILLYCVSNYPSKIEDFNLNNIKILKDRYKCKVGFSDHSNDNNILACAVASGAEIIEKHIALEGQKSGPDIAFSIKGKEIKECINLIKKTSKLLGRNSFFITKSELKNKIFRRSIYATKNIRKGEKFTLDNIKVIRPSYGLKPVFYEKLLNKKSPLSILKATPLKNNILSKLKIKK